MKVYVNQIPFEGLILEEEISASELDLETDIFRFRKPLSVKANISKITNVVTAHLTIKGFVYTNCSRCFDELEIDFKKDLELNYPIDNLKPQIDLNPDIREEIVLDYPMKPLCSQDCKGLCPKCGKNLNEGGCFCGST